MEINSHNSDYFEKSTDRAGSLLLEVKITREEMEKETRTFIEATKNFSLEWIQREVHTDRSHLKGKESYYENIKAGKIRLGELPCPDNLPFRIREIVEMHLNRDDYWVHRKELSHADISRDYLEFKKEKIRKDLTSNIRMILGCAAEIFADFKDESNNSRENKVWVKERGKRKYICILRFSDEMTASLERYFAMLEDLFALEYEIREIEKKENKEIEKNIEDEES